MSGIVVVYELDRSMTAGAVGGGARTDEAPVRRVHAAPAAPGTAATPGPRTFCGKDTFAMEAAPWAPSEHPGAPWCGPRYADRVCGDCDTAMEED
ncbi:hypothetical protein ABZ719_00985 [Streptomyces sp. NPDC006743]|uniref:hypothetical protein n=1 Tax=Streptomyces sp. NPDC006743 TaxID=3154480 RepID=UPI0034519840